MTDQRLETRVPHYLAKYAKERAAEMNLSISAYLCWVLEAQYNEHTINREKRHANASRNGI